MKGKERKGKERKGKEGKRKERRDERSGRLVGRINQDQSEMKESEVSRAECGSVADADAVRCRRRFTG